MSTNNPANPSQPANTNVTTASNPPLNAAPIAADPTVSVSSDISQSSTSSSTTHQSKAEAFFSKLGEIFKKVIKKLFIWFIFTVIVGLLPIIASWFLGHFDHQLTDPLTLFFHGELLIISFALAADAMGDLVNSNKLGDFIGVFLFGICFALFALSGLVFAGLSILGTAIDKQAVANFSFYMIGATFLASMGCKIRTEV